METSCGRAAWSKSPLGSAPARLLRLLTVRLSALDSSAHSQGEAQSLGARPLPRVLERAASKPPISPPLTIQVAGTKLRIGGHSLGGALATLSFLELSLQGQS